LKRCASRKSLPAQSGRRAARALLKPLQYNAVPFMQISHTSGGKSGLENVTAPIKKITNFVSGEGQAHLFTQISRRKNFFHRAKTDRLHGKKGFVIPTKSFVKIGTKIFCYNKMFGSINKTFGCCGKIFGCSNKNFICRP